MIIGNKLVKEKLAMYIFDIVLINSQNLTHRIKSYTIKMTERSVKFIMEVVSMAKRRDKEIDILNAATKVFGVNGFHLTIIDDIAKCANIAKGTVYQYFRSKDELFIRVIKYNYDLYFAQLQEKVDAEQSFIDKMNMFIDHHEKVIEADLKAAEIVFHNGGLSLKQETQDEIFEYLDAQRAKVLKIIEHILEKGIGERKVRDINENLIADLIFDMVVRYCRRSARMQYSQEQKNSEKGVLVSMILQGVGTG